MLNRSTFFENIKGSLFLGSLTSLQVDVTEAIIDQSEKQGMTDLRQLAYCLATTYHECYNWNLGAKGRMVQLEEMGGMAYLKSKSYWPYYGRGPSHLTHLANYKKESNRTGFDLVRNPNMMLDINIGAESHIYCMVHGSYTGRSLSDYINSEGCNFVSARAIINPRDSKTFELVAGYARKFLSAMQ